MYEGDIKTIPRPQKLYRAGTPSPGFEISGSATGILMENMKFFWFPKSTGDIGINGLQIN